MKRVLFVLLFLIATTALPGFASRSVVDELGRHVAVPDHPHRIICLVPNITDDVFALGGGGDVIAVSDYVKYPEAATKKPSVGSITAPSIETIVALHPDLILGMSNHTQQATIDQIERLGIPVFLIETHGLAGILESIISIGDAINREPQAISLVASLKRRIDAVHISVRGKPVINVFMPVWYDPVITIGKGAFITEIIEVAGGHSVTADITQEWPHISMEAVISRAPTALLLVQGGKITLELLRAKPGWSGLPAVKERNAYYVDGRVDLPSPVAIDALEDLAKQFHP